MGWYSDGSNYYCTWSVGGASSLSLNVTYTVPQPLSITTSSLPLGVVGAGYSTQLAAGGGSGSYNRSISSGSLPGGLVLSSAGVISGAPTGGSSTFGVQVTDSDSNSATAQFTLTVTPGTTITAYNNSSGPCTITDGLAHTISMPSPEYLPNGGTGSEAVFSNWSDAGANPHTIQPGTSVTANFTVYYQFTGIASPSGGGTVMLGIPNSQGVVVSSGVPASAWYQAGTTFWTTAQPNSGFGFLTLSNGFKQQAIVMNAAVTQTAYFSNNVFTVSTSPAPTMTQGKGVTAHFYGSSTSSNGSTYNSTTLGSFSCYSVTQQIMAAISNITSVNGNLSFDATFLSGESATPGEYDITCSCNYYECFVDVGPVYVEPPTLPTVLISGPQGIPQGGSGIFTVTVSASVPDAPIVLGLNTSQGTGSATFDDPSSATINSSGTFSVKVDGAVASSSANNIVLSATYGGETIASQPFSVVWVTLSLHASNPPIQTDPELTNFQALVGGSAAAQGGLGAEIYYNGSDDPYACAVGIELVGAVTPSDYQGLVSINKAIVGSAIFDGQNPTTGIARPPGPDNIGASLEDNVVGVGATGQVFDLDAPAVGAISTSGNAERFRTNVQAYAVLGDFGDTTAPQSSTLFAYSVAVSCGGTLLGPQLDTTYVVNGDNAASVGTINLTYNLLPSGQ